MRHSWLVWLGLRESGTLSVEQAVAHVLNGEMAVGTAARLAGRRKAELARAVEEAVYVSSRIGLDQPRRRKIPMWRSTPALVAFTILGLECLVGLVVYRDAVADRVRWAIAEITNDAVALDALQHPQALPPRLPASAGPSGRQPGNGAPVAGAGVAAAVATRTPMPAPTQTTAPRSPATALIASPVSEPRAPGGPTSLPAECDMSPSERTAIASICRSIGSSAFSMPQCSCFGPR